MKSGLQWGGRFGAEPDAALLAFGSSLEDDLVLAPFDVRCSRAHVAVLRAAGIVDEPTFGALEAALHEIANEIETGHFDARARAGGAEDVHGAIDARVRELAGDAGLALHTGRSRNDQVATTLALYVRDRAARGRELARGIASRTVARARVALREETLLSATTHWQPAQPILLAFWLGAVAETFTRGVQRFARVEADARGASPLGAGACSGSSLPLDRELAARLLEFTVPTRNALDTAGDRDLGLDLLQAVTRAVIAASRVSEELVLWCTPTFGYAKLDDAASTGSSLMPQKRNPDPFELVRAAGAAAIGAYAGALGTTNGLALSYHRDLQETKAQIIRGTERGLAALAAFARAFEYVRFDAAAMNARAGDGYVVATDIADALIVRGVAARRAHALVGERVASAEGEHRPLDASDLAALTQACAFDAPLEAPLDALASVRAKRTLGSTNPEHVEAALDALEGYLV